MSSREITRGLTAELDRQLRELVGLDSPVAYVNFPNIGNLGDSAIYAGARSALRAAGVEVAVAVEPRAYQRSLIRRAVGERGTIVLHGGANFGDIYMTQPQQVTRAKVLRDFPAAQIVQLPQTIYFGDPARSAKFIERCRSHERLTIMVRDRPSGERLAALGLDSKLVPDLAFGLGPLERPAPAEVDVTWVIREDVERSFEPGSVDAGAADWPSGADQRGGVTGRALKWNLDAVRALGSVRDRLPQRLRLTTQRLAASRYGPIADRRLALALAQVTRGRVLVTDRLHGHILACMCGVPNVVLDNSYGKNRGFFEAWTSRYPTTRFAGDLVAARSLAAELASEAA